MKITLQDGIVLENLKLNGNNFISDEIIETSIFENNLGNVKIEDEDGNIVEQKNMRLIQNIVIGKESWFILAEKSQNDILKERIATQDMVIEELMFNIIPSITGGI